MTSPGLGEFCRNKHGTDPFFLTSQFGSLLDENAGSKFDNIGLNAMANTDRAGGTENIWSSDLCH